MRFVSPAQLRELDHGDAAALRGAPECVIVAGEGTVDGVAAVALFYADYAVLTRDAVVVLDSADVWSAIAWRAGRVALRLQLEGVETLRAEEAHALELCDEVFDEAPDTWLTSWLGRRSEAALDAAALLIRSRGGDAEERKAFANLFATGEPQRGLRTFLERRRRTD